MNQNLKTFKVTYLKNEKVLYWTEQSTETVLIEAKCSFDARIKAWELPGCVVVLKSYVGSYGGWNTGHRSQTLNH